VEAALDVGVVPEFVITGPRLAESERGSRLLGRLAACDAPLFHASEAAFAAASDTETPQGVLGVFALAGLPAWPSTTTLLVALDGVRDPGNVGTIMRSAAAAGADGVVLMPECADPFGGKAVRAAMGAHFRLPLLSTEWERVGTDLPGMKIVVASAAARAIYDEWDWTQPSMVVIGAEAIGVSDEGTRNADVAVRVPMVGDSESINAAAAAAILLFAAARARARESGERRYEP
jgi:TrmH family RNA methyltransferase